MFNTKFYHTALAFCLLLLSSCYSEYKAVSYNPVLKPPVDLTTYVYGSTFSILPVFRVENYTAHLYFENKGDTMYRITNLQLNLKNAFSKSEKKIIKSTDSVVLYPGGKVQLKYAFPGKSRLFPHKVALQITASLQQANQLSTISQTYYFTRYMYFNPGGI
jgi:hypothetical protein